MKSKVSQSSKSPRWVTEAIASLDAATRQKLMRDARRLKCEPGKIIVAALMAFAKEGSIEMKVKLPCRMISAIGHRAKSHKLTVSEYLLTLAQYDIAHKVLGGANARK